MNVKESARCIHYPDCESLGEPKKVAEQHEKMYTIYECAGCGQMWYRPHNP